MAESPTGKRFRVTKMVEARRLNPNSGIPLTEPPTAIPFGATLENVRAERDLYKFVYLGKPFQCLQSLLKPAMEPINAAEASSTPADISLPEPAIAPAASAEPAAPSPFQWETIATSHGPLLRAKVPGGWLLMTGRGAALVFYPDPQHKWNGETLAE
jgi:hypothetical protein